jgi:hypothetical protein
LEQTAIRGGNGNARLPHIAVVKFVGYAWLCAARGLIMLLQCTPGGMHDDVVYVYCVYIKNNEWQLRQLA